MPKYEGLTNSFLSIPDVGEKQKAEKKKKKKKKEKRKKKKKVGENNCQLRFVRHHVLRTQARLDQYLNPADLVFLNYDLYLMIFYLLPVTNI